MMNDLTRTILVGAAVCLRLAAGEAEAAIPASERAALIALYNSTDGPGWVNRTGWRNAADTDFGAPGTECTWMGVFCDYPFDHVTHLYLNGNNLQGRIPGQIGQLTGLTGLDLGDNRLVGSIPPQIGNLPILWDLSLRNNGLSGAIPPELGRLDALWTMGLSGNQLSGPIPPELGHLGFLGELILSNNQLSGPIPPEFGSLPGLSHLDLSGNQLSGPIPATIGDLRRLKWGLYLQANELSGPIPPSLGRLPILQVLRLDGNRLSGPIPPELGSIGTTPGSGPSTLVELNLSSNQLSGSLPIELRSLWLKQLNLSDNQLTDLPLEVPWPAFAGIESIDLSRNQLSGPIPGWVFAAGRKHLDLADNQFSGPIPAEVGTPAGLLDLSLSRNHLSGPIPTQMGDLIWLTALQLDGNQLVGPIPTSLAHLTDLGVDQLDLRWNGLLTDDPSLRSFLNSRQTGADWEATQTVAPAGLQAGNPGVDTVALSWTLIPYTADAGGYRLWYSTTSGGPYEPLLVTPDKSAASAVAAALRPITTYHFVADTVTRPHAGNPNAVTSERTPEVSAATTAGGLTWYSLTVVKEGVGTGTVASPDGIECGGVCAAAYAPGATLTLTATPDSLQGFQGWTGACSGLSPTCVLTMDSAKVVTARFSGPPPRSFYTVTPCRMVDSRDTGPLTAGVETPVPATGHCELPSSASAVSLNVTVVEPSEAGHLTLYASGSPRPETSSINYSTGQTRANNAIVPLGADGTLAVYVGQASGTVHVVIDVNGYFE
jgi:Leucine-rich repeat (LRR) protein